jgi:ApaG protein
MVPYAATTQGVTVTVRPVYLEGQSDPFGRRFVFGYFVEVENGGETEVQLLRRHWRIQDGDDPMKEVEGPGVVGQQPVIPPGESHSYNSFCVLEAMEGSMEGSYLLQRPSGQRFRVAIPRFYLRARAN